MAYYFLHTLFGETSRHSPILKLPLTRNSVLASVAGGAVMIRYGERWRMLHAERDYVFQASEGRG